MTDKIDLLGGTAVKTEKGYFYIKNGKRLRIPTTNILRSWRFHRIAKATEEQVAHYPIMGRVGFRDGTLVFCIADGKYYIIENSRLVHVTDPQTIRNHGLKRRDAFVISKKERDIHGVAR